MSFLGIVRTFLLPIQYNTLLSAWFYNYNFKAFVHPSGPDSKRREKINLKFYFHASLWCLKRFYESLYKTFKAPQKSMKIKI